jgi:hypothetical protein
MGMPSPDMAFNGHGPSRRCPLMGIRNRVMGRFGAKADTTAIRVSLYAVG